LLEKGFTIIALAVKLAAAKDLLILLQANMKKKHKRRDCSNFNLGAIRLFQALSRHEWDYKSN